MRVATVKGDGDMKPPQNCVASLSYLTTLQVTGLTAKAIDVYKMKKKKMWLTLWNLSTPDGNTGLFVLRVIWDQTKTSPLSLGIKYIMRG